jgi:hypothetical protein
VPHVGQYLALRNTETTQAIGHEAPGLVLEASEQALEETLGGSGVPPIPDKDVEHDAVLVDRAPEDSAVRR